jgi:hypothetical protein
MKLIYNTLKINIELALMMHDFKEIYPSENDIKLWMMINVIDYFLQDIIIRMKK